MTVRGLGHHESIAVRAATRCAMILLLAVTAAAQTHPEDRPTAGLEPLRSAILADLEAGEIERAVQRAQDALNVRPDDAEVRREFVSLHLSLAADWLRARRIDDARAALRAVLAVSPDDTAAARMLADITEARTRAERSLPELDVLLRMELFDPAMSLASEIASLRPDLGPRVDAALRRAQRGLADDHLAASNFREAFALYDDLLDALLDSAADEHDGATGELRRRWGIALGLSLADENSEQPSTMVGPTRPTLPADARSDLAQRVAHVLEPEPVLAGLVLGMIALHGGQPLEAGQRLAAALEQVWSLPPAAQRELRIRQLRDAGLARLRALLAETRIRDRGPGWQATLPDAWRRSATPHFEVFARNDVVAGRVGEAAQWHLPRLAQWLGVELPSAWTPLCVVRVYGTLEELHERTGGGEPLRAVTHVRTQAGVAIDRTLHVYQHDPWLLSSTLPHELAHVLLAEIAPEGGLPLVLDEGLALQAEPPARRLQFRRHLPTAATPLERLLAAAVLPADPVPFYAEADAFVGMLLVHFESDASERSVAAGVAEVFQAGAPADWPRRFGWSDAATAEQRWSGWSALRRDPPRIPLLIRAAPVNQPPEDREGNNAGAPPAGSRPGEGG